MVVHSAGLRTEAVERPRVLLVGPRVIANDVVGGTKVTFERLLTDLRNRGNLTLTVVDTSRRLANRGPFEAALVNSRTLATVLFRVWRHAATVDLVVWAVSSGGALWTGPFVRLLCACRRRPLVVRLFGGDLAARLASAPAPVRYPATRTFRAVAALLLETRQLCEDLGASFRTVWFPNTRDMPPRRAAFRSTCRRLLFLSRLHPDKGLPELLEAANRFPAPVRLSVYGAAIRPFDVRDIDAARNATYCGPAAPCDVPGILEAHDALVLPTRYAGEGYPGVIIEAFQMGLPVLVTPLPPIRELVTSERDGLFVSGSPESILGAALRISSDDRLFRRLRAGALETGERFRSGHAAARFEALCRGVIRRKQAPCAAS